MMFSCQAMGTYKKNSFLQAIFSDDSDDEGEDSNIKRVENQEKKAEVANTALSRLIASDFLESLGKELGLEVPPDTPNPMQKLRTAAPQKENVNEYAKTDILKGENNTLMSSNHDLPHDQNIAHEGGPSKDDTIYGNMPESSSIKTKGTSISNNSKSSKFNGEKCEDDRKIKSPLISKDHSSSSEEERSRKRSGKFNGEKHEEYRKIKTPHTHRRDYRSSSSSEEERSRKRSRHHRHMRRDTGSDSSSDDERDGHSSRSKGRRREGFSREKSSGSKKHSKHHKHRKHKSPSRSSYPSMEKDDAHSRKEKRRRE